MQQSDISLNRFLALQIVLHHLCGDTAGRPWVHTPAESTHRQGDTHLQHTHTCQIYPDNGRADTPSPAVTHHHQPPTVSLLEAQRHVHTMKHKEPDMITSRQQSGSLHTHAHPTTPAEQTHERPASGAMAPQTPSITRRHHQLHVILAPPLVTPSSPSGRHSI